MERVGSISTDFGGRSYCPGPLMAEAKAAGFGALHWTHDWAGLPSFYSEDFGRQVRQLIDLHQCPIPSVHGYSGTLETGVRYSDELFTAAQVNRAEFARQIGADAIVLHLPTTDCDSLDEAIDRSITALQSIRPAFEACGVRVAVENLHRPCHIEAFFDALFSTFDEGFVGFCYDSGHAVLTGRQSLLRSYAHRLLVTHLHDNDGSSDQHRLPGEGQVDWEFTMGVLRESGFAGPINLELNQPHEVDLADYLRQARERLDRLWQVPATP